MPLLLWSAFAFAAPLEALERVEVALDDFEDWTVVPLGEDGLVLVGAGARSHEYEVRKFDTAFREEWTQRIVSDERTALFAQATSSDFVWFAMGKPGGDEFDLVGFDKATGARTDVPWIAEDPLVSLEGLQVDDAGHAWTIGRGKPKRTGLYHVTLPGGEAERLDVAARVGADRVLVAGRMSGPGPTDRTLTVAEIEKGHRTLSLVPYGTAGLGDPITLDTAPAGVHLLTGMAMPAAPGAGTVIGTYATGDRDQGAQGMFVSGYADHQPLWTKTHDFASFAHFFDYLPEGRQGRITNAIERKEAAGKNVELDYLLYLHAPLLLADRTVFVAEAYQPIYHTVTRTSTSTVGGKTTTTTTTTVVFDGYLFTHAVVAAFDADGDLLWDASAPIGNVLLPRVQPVVAVVPSADALTLMYASNKTIYSIVADASGVTGERGEQAPAAQEEGESVKRGWSTRSVWWYDDVFLTWGYQKIKEDAGKRTVFQFSTLRAGATP